MLPAYVRVSLTYAGQSLDIDDMLLVEHCSSSKGPVAGALLYMDLPVIRLHHTCHRRFEYANMVL